MVLQRMKVWLEQGSGRLCLPRPSMGMAADGAGSLQGHRGAGLGMEAYPASIWRMLSMRDSAWMLLVSSSTLVVNHKVKILI